MSKSQAVFALLGRVLRQEVELFHAFTNWNVSASILPGCIFGLSASRILYDQSQLITPILLRLSSCLVWTLLFIYIFDISNQIMSVEEDKVNKPERPLCTGQVTHKEAAIRWVVLLVLFLATTYLNPLLLAPTVTWVSILIPLCFTPLGKHWAFKNSAAMGVGTWTLLAGSWQTILPLTPIVQNQIIFLALWVGSLVPLQDLRDIQGDLKINRKTLPIIFGDVGSRYMIAFVFIPLGYFFLWIGDIVEMIPISLTLIHLLLGYRILKGLGKGDAWYDHITYMILVYSFSYILAWMAITNSQSA